MGVGVNLLVFVIQRPWILVILRLGRATSRTSLWKTHPKPNVDSLRFGISLSVLFKSIRAGQCSVRPRVRLLRCHSNLSYEAVRFMIYDCVEAAVPLLLILTTAIKYFVLYQKSTRKLFSLPAPPPFPGSLGPPNVDKYVKRNLHVCRGGTYP